MSNNPTTAITAVTAELDSKLAELKRAEAAMNKLPKLRADIAALQRTIAILKKEEPPPQVAPPPPVVTTRYRDASGNLFAIVGGAEAMTMGTSSPHPLPVVPKREQTIPEMATAVLRETGKEMSANEIMSALLAKDSTLDKQSVLGALYRNAKLGRIFKLVKPGIFGLQEWEKRGAQVPA